MNLEISSNSSDVLASSIALESNLSAQSSLLNLSTSSSENSETVPPSESINKTPEDRSRKSL
jgi:hypothetical protein